ncbi:MAG TPA: hypothetical protein VMR52_05835 [Dehalococcoidia bacterium]|nr:hypothetical protein [Dehalococcoidia bacterium]
MNQQPQSTTVFLTGTNRSTKLHERHLLTTNADGSVLHLSAKGSNNGIEEESLTAAELPALVGRLLMSGLRVKPLVPAKAPLESFMDQVELFFRVRTSLLFFLGLSSFTAAYWLIVGVSEWYEWGTFIAALILGSLLSKATKLSFLGASIETEQWTNMILY